MTEKLHKTKPIFLTGLRSLFGFGPTFRFVAHVWVNITVFAVYAWFEVCAASVLRPGVYSCMGVVHSVGVFGSVCSRGKEEGGMDGGFS